jgi:hypothetical protein
MARGDSADEVHSAAAQFTTETRRARRRTEKQSFRGTLAEIVCHVTIGGLVDR